MFVIDILDIDIVFCCIIIYRVELPHFFCFSKLCASMELWSDELVDTADSFLLSSSWKEDPYSNIVRVIYDMIWFVWKEKLKLCAELLFVLFVCVTHYLYHMEKKTRRLRCALPYSYLYKYKYDKSHPKRLSISPYKIWIEMKCSNQKKMKISEY